MPSWVSRNRDDILFIISLVVGVGLIVVGLWTGDSPTMLLGAGALGIGGFNDVAKGSA